MYLGDLVSISLILIPNYWAYLHTWVHMHISPVGSLAIWTLVIEHKNTVLARDWNVTRAI